MIRFLALIFLAGPAGAGPLWALPEDGSGVVTEEIEEAVEPLPGMAIPWHDSLLELPRWMSQEAGEIEGRTRPANQGAGLFPPEVWPLQPEPEQGPLIWDEARAGEARRPEGGRVATPVALGPELMTLYTALKPERVLADPQHLVPGDRVESLVQRWLNEQCVFRTTVLLFGAGQQLPAGFDAQALRREWFGDGGDELLVFYFYGEPQRTLAIFGPNARTHYGADLLRSVVDAAVLEAGRVGGGLEQLERFCYKMSVRLHWLARTAPLPEGVGTAEVAGAAGTGFWKKSGPALGWMMTVWAGGGLLLRWMRRRRAGAGAADGPAPVVLPEREFQPRFGAPHSGGFSSMITFAGPPATPGSGP